MESKRLAGIVFSLEVHQRLLRTQELIAPQPSFSEKSAVSIHDFDIHAGTYAVAAANMSTGRAVETAARISESDALKPIMAKSLVGGCDREYGIKIGMLRNMDAKMILMVGVGNPDQLRLAIVVNSVIWQVLKTVKSGQLKSHVLGAKGWNSCLDSVAPMIVIPRNEFFGEKGCQCILADILTV